MTFKQLNTLLKSTGYPVAYYQFEKPPNIPFIVYMDGGSDVYGDDFSNKITVQNYVVELYTDKKDLTAEGKVESVLNFTGFNKSENYIDSEKLYQIVYEFTTTEKR
jgi:hypothetical protein